MLSQEPQAGFAFSSRGKRSLALGLALLAILGFVAGVVVVMATNAVEQAGIEGQGWSLRGNGALIVPACAFPILFLMGVTVFARWLRADGLSWLGGLAAGIFALLLGLLLSYVVSKELLPLALLFAFSLALLLARGSGRRRAVGWVMAGVLLLPAVMYAGWFIAASVILSR